MYIDGYFFIVYYIVIDLHYQQVHCKNAQADQILDSILKHTASDFFVEDKSNDELINIPYKTATNIIKREFTGQSPMDIFQILDIAKYIYHGKRTRADGQIRYDCQREIDGIQHSMLCVWKEVIDRGKT